MSKGGGVIVYGVEEDKTRRVASEITPVPIDGVEERIRNAAREVEPRLEFEVRVLRPSPDAPAGVVAVVVPASPNWPHMVNGRFPIRDGTTTRYLSHAEAEAAFAQRRAAAVPSDSPDHRVGGGSSERQGVADNQLQTAAVRLRANLEGLRRRMETALSSRFYWTDLLASDVFERYEPDLTRRPDVHQLVVDAFLRFHELNQRVPLGEETMPDETLSMVNDALLAAHRASTSLAELADELASAGSNAGPGPTVSADVIERELNSHVTVAARDLLSRKDEITPADIEGWASSTGITIRVHCGESWEFRFLAEGRGRGLSPRDELNTKVYFIHNELAPQVRRDAFKSGPRG
jgi:hypothetical protein